MANPNFYLTPHFRLSEFDCKDGTAVPKDLYYNVRMLAGTLEAIRFYCKCPLIINSAYRSPQHNKKVGGAKNSYHLSAMAVDFRPKNFDLRTLFDDMHHFMLKGLIPKGALILYPTFIHYDRRGTILKLDYSRAK